MSKSKRKGFTVFILTFALFINCFGEEDFFSTGPAAFTFDEFLMKNLPGGFFYPSFLENYAPGAAFMIEENNAFALIDNPRVYYEGDSFINFNWFYNGGKINSALNPGSPAVLLPFSATSGYRMQGETPKRRDYGLNFISRMPREDIARVMVSSVYPDMGGYIDGLISLIPDHALNRDDFLYSTRRKTLGNFFVDGMLGKKFADSALSLSFNYFHIKRQFNDFNALDTTFEETGKLFLVNARFQKELKKGGYEIFAVFNHSDRSNFNAETGCYPQETGAQKRDSFLTGFNLNKKSFDLKFSFQLEKETIAPVVENFYKDLKDNDGDGLFPSGRWGDFSAAVFNLDLDVPLTIRLSSGAIKMNAFVDIRHSILQGSEEINAYNPIFFDKTPYLVVSRQEGGDYTNSNSNVKFGLNMAWDISASVSLSSRLFAHYNRLGIESPGAGFSFFSPGFDMGLHLFKNKKTEIFLSLGQIPYDTRENLNYFLETRRPSGAVSYWNDHNNDAIFQTGEAGQTFAYTGGRYHAAAEDLSAPVKQRFLITLSTKVSQKWVFSLKGILKKIKNNFAVRFPNEEDYGFFESHNGYDVFFLDSPPESYLLSNYDYRKEPIYAQLLINLKGGEKDRWFFDFSFLSHMGLGVTAFGNGPGSNDIGIISESMANPNSRINGFGRVDGDRAFLGKIYFGFYMTRNLFMGVSLKYRDGNPFAFIDSFYAHNQWALYYSTIQAEDEKGVKGGPREDFLSDVSIKLNYKFKLFDKDALLSLSIFNLLDLGHELSEYAFSGGSRYAAELHIPRSMRLTFAMGF
ncbi:MAG: hypothetical protein KAW12_07680 [Candidatus Aminicenantes bacterium]|nr:hypothetical protein [Candidatus Aminicenantes bacterium]